jgi:hypothetical protein
MIEGTRGKDERLARFPVKPLVIDIQRKKSHMRAAGRLIALRRIYIQKGNASLRKAFVVSCSFELRVTDSVVYFLLFAESRYGYGESSSFALLARFLYVPTIAFAHFPYQV